MLLVLILLLERRICDEWEKIKKNNIYYDNVTAVYIHTHIRNKTATHDDDAYDVADGASISESKMQLVIFDLDALHFATQLQL